MRRQSAPKLHPDQTFNGAVVHDPG